MNHHSKEAFVNYEAFANWCEKQGNRSYDYTRPDGCAYYQYLSSLGLAVQGVQAGYWIERRWSPDCIHLDYINHNIDPEIQRQLGSKKKGQKWTFASLAQRLRETA